MAADIKQADPGTEPGLARALLTVLVLIGWTALLAVLIYLMIKVIT